MNHRTLKNAHVVDYQKRRKPSKHYVYVINVTWSDNSVVVIFRRYSKFFELQTKLFEEFPEEGGVKDPSKRSLPFLPGKIIFGRSNIRDVAEKRKEPINDYCQSLIKLPTKISQCDLVLDFFEPTDEDVSPVEVDEQKDKKKIKEERAQCISEPIQLDQYIVIADYQRQNQREVSVLAGDIVEVIEKCENGWWFVNMDEEQGWVPASYLEPEDGSVESAVSTTYKPGEERYIASCAYTANEPDEIGFQKGVVVDVLQKNVDGWWLIRFNGKDGWAPAIYLKKLNPAQALPRPHGYENINLSNEPVIPKKPVRQRPPREDNENRSNKPPPRKSSVRKSHKVKNRVRTPPSKDGRPSASSINEAEYVALSDYRAQGLSNRLSVEVGVSVQILEKSPNGWWFCRIGDKEGWVPSTYLQRQEKKPKPVVPAPPATKTPVVKPGFAKSPVVKPGFAKPPVVKPGMVQSPAGDSVASTLDTEYIAISDYKDNERLNITLKEGAVVKVLEKSNSGWWYVESGGAAGWAPSTYLEKNQKEKPKLPMKTNMPRPSPRPKGSPRPPPARPSPPAKPVNVRTGQRNTGKLAPPLPNRRNKPSLKDTDGQLRAKPRPNSASVENLLQRVQLKVPAPLKHAHSADNLSSDGVRGSRGNAGPRGIVGTSTNQYYVVLADFNDEDEDTLDLKKGDRLEVLQRDEGGWWFAKLGGRTGWVPSNYLEK